MTDASRTTRRTGLSAWLKDEFIPRWAERACPPGVLGYMEEFLFSGEAQAPPIVHTTMVTGRLVYTFSLAYRFDKAPRTLRAAEHGLAFLLDHCRVGPGQFAHHLGSDGAMIDADADLYDLAFVLLAIGGYSEASGRTDVLEFAHEIALRLDHEWIDPLGGYHEPAGTATARLQYPQMHLFEAFQMLAAVDPSGGWSGRAERIVNLAALLVNEHGAIDEWFNAQWDPLGPKRRRREIGHHFEWAWLLFVYATKTGSERAVRLAWRLFDFGLKAAEVPPAGPDQTILNSIDAWGTFTSAWRPLWPTLELAKASLAAATLDKNDKYLSLARQSLEIILSQIDTKNNTWVNQAGSNDLDSPGPLPARTLYHILPSLIFFATGETNIEGTDKIEVLRPF